MAGLLASEVMDESALLLLDAAKLTFTYTVQAPWLKKAINKFSDELALNSIKVPNPNTNTTVLTAAVGMSLPSDCIYPTKLEERLSGSTDQFTEMFEVSLIPTGAVQTQTLGVWTFATTNADSIPSIQFLGATTDRQVRISYLRFLPYAGLTSATDLGAYVTWAAKGYLASKVAEYISIYVLQNAKRAQPLHDESEECLYKFIQIWTKQMQNLPTRKSRFMMRRS